MAQIFLSHTKRDSSFCNTFDTIASRVGIKVFRSEFEDIKSPPWKTIKDAIAQSNVLFLLVGKELVKAQAQSESNALERDKWKYTQNWIAYEIGLACQRGIDVWVVCDNIPLNFPVPYLTNYEIYGFSITENRQFYRTIIGEYNKGKNYPVGLQKSKYHVKCGPEGCGVEFNIFSALKKGDTLLCPSCLREMVAKMDFPKV